MVSTRRKSYQPGSTPDGATTPAGSTRLRHNSLSTPTVTDSPRRGRRASSLNPLEAEGSSEETAQARGHRTKALLERYRSEAAGALKIVEEEAAKNGGEPAEAEAEVVPAEATPADTVTETTAEPSTQDTEPDAQIDVEEVEEKSGEQEAAEAVARKVAAAQRVLATVTKVSAPAAAPVAAQVPTVAVTVAAAPALTRIRPAPKPRGIAKSGRFWKSVRTQASQVVVRTPVTYEERMQKRQQQKVVKDLENQLKDERKQKMQELRKRREYNAKKAAENALKAEVYQVVKNPNKIKRMKKKQLRLLQKRDTTVVGKSVLDE